MIMVCLLLLGRSCCVVVSFGLNGGVFGFTDWRFVW